MTNTSNTTRNFQTITDRIIDKLAIPFITIGFITLIFTALYFTQEPITVQVIDGVEYVVETSQGEVFRELTEMDARECRITYVK